MSFATVTFFSTGSGEYISWGGRSLLSPPLSDPEEKKKFEPRGLHHHRRHYVLQSNSDSRGRSGDGTIMRVFYIARCEFSLPFDRVSINRGRLYYYYCSSTTQSKKNTWLIALRLLN